MDQLFYVMAIMGCGDGAANCTEARVAEARYATVQQCRADLPAALTRHTDLSYPVITATCRRTTPAIAKLTAKGARG